METTGTALKVKEIKKTKHWWARNYYKAEAWLEQQEAEGLRMVGVNSSGSRFKFVKDIPRKVRFVIDYQAAIGEVYLAKRRSEGWEPFVINSNWCVCRKEYTDERPVLSNDYSSLIRRNQKHLNIILFFFMPVLIAGPAANGWLLFTDFDPGYWATPAKFIYFGACIGFILGIISLSSTGRMLKMKADDEKLQ